MNIHERADFVRGIAQLLFYQTNRGNLEVDEEYVTRDGFPLGEFARRLRSGYQDGTLQEYQVERLRQIGFAMSEEDQAWESMLIRVRDYVEQHDGMIPGVMERTEDDVMVGAWVRKQRVTWRSLPDGKKEMLMKVGIYAEN